MSICCVWDFTAPEFCTCVEDIKKLLQTHSKKWTFQKEHSCDDYIHYQGRFSLKQKKRLTFLKDVFPKEFHFSPTSNANRDNDFYCCKDDTRIEGPWKDTDEVIYIPRQIREIGELRPFQKSIIEISKVWNTRHINIVYCPTGNLGKSILKTYMGVYKLGRPLPFVNDYKELMQVVMDLPTSNCYILDLPRALDKRKLREFFGSLETLKDGHAFDLRYSYREKYFDCPNIFVFTNSVPDSNLLSADRWKLWTINNNYELIIYEENETDSDNGLQ